MTHQLVFCLICAGPVASAQRPPWSQVVSDTNSAAELLGFGRTHLRSRDDSLRALADSALVRAARLDPASAEPSYTLAIATLWPAVRKSRGFFHSGNVWRHLSARQVTRLDSLLRETRRREPFASPALDPLLAREDLPPPGLVRDRESRAYVAYQAGQYRMALRLWAELIGRSPQRNDLRWHRAHVFYRLHQYDSVVVTLHDMMRVLLAISDTLQGRFTPATDVLHYAIGIAYERAGKADSAAESYRSTLIANLGTYMAHVRLAEILMQAGDTADALREVAVALDVAPHDPLILAHNASVLIRAGRSEQALEPLQAVIDVNPAYAMPYFLLGMAYTDLHRDPEALRAFEMFLERAALDENRRVWTRERVKVLRAALKDRLR